MHLRSPATNSASAIARATRALVLSLLLFAAAFGPHEVMHLLVLYAVGGHGSIVARPWRLGLADASIYALHVKPDQPIGMVRQMLVNFLGPVLAGIPLAALFFYVREPVVRIALSAIWPSSPSMRSSRRAIFSWRRWPISTLGS
jgi:hypothetical protein